MHFSQVIHLFSFLVNKMDGIDDVFLRGVAALGSNRQPSEVEQSELKMCAAGPQNPKACISKVFKCSH